MSDACQIRSGGNCIFVSHNVIELEKYICNNICHYCVGINLIGNLYIIKVGRDGTKSE